VAESTPFETFHKLLSPNNLHPAAAVSGWSGMMLRCNGLQNIYPPRWGLVR
jgi:hypothetical protein